MSDVTTPKSEDLRIADIVVRDRLRPVSEAGVESLLASIRDIGAIKDEIHVRQARRAGKVELRLLAGGHRLEAARRLGWETIRAKVWRDITDETARLIEVDDNLAGAEMNALDTAVFLAERKRVYEEMHPETRHGVAGAMHKNCATDIMSVASVASFATATAEKFGLTERHVRRMIAAGGALTVSDVVRLRRAPRPVTQADLQVIARIDATGDRIAVVEALSHGRATSAAKALKTLAADLEAAPAPAPVDRGLTALRTAWSRASAEARRRWVTEVFDELAPLATAEGMRVTEAASATLIRLIEGGAA